MNFWKTLSSELKEDHSAVFMYVTESIGSSPGRRGFKMFVSSSGCLVGSIGGGFMEHKLVEFCKEDLLKRDFQPFIKRQIHQASVPENKSGMICSGEQTIAFYHLSHQHLSTIDKIVCSMEDDSFGILKVQKNELGYQSGSHLDEKFQLEVEGSWPLSEDLGFQPELHVVGGGHVSLALSKMASQLDFTIITYDDRPGLNTVEQNPFARHVHIQDYAATGKYLSEGQNKYVVLMSFGFRTDKVVLKQLIDHDFKYLGMMGSEEKVRQLFEELLEEGITQEQISRVHSPIGIQIKSETPEEIAVSIMAEIIREKNTSF